MMGVAKPWVKASCQSIQCLFLWLKQHGEQVSRDDSHLEVAVVMIGSGISGMYMAVDFIRKSNWRNIIILEQRNSESLEA